MLRDRMAKLFAKWLRISRSLVDRFMSESSEAIAKRYLTPFCHSFPVLLSICRIHRFCPEICGQVTGQLWVLSQKLLSLHFVILIISIEFHLCRDVEVYRLIIGFIPWYRAPDLDYWVYTGVKMFTPLSSHSYLYNPLYHATLCEFGSFPRKNAQQYLNRTQLTRKKLCHTWLRE
jgi:hypothetical protein